ncbi:MAG: NAD-dependent epimerase/dehydratase family protein [Chloroflexota bacterium]|nr:NAD-dependent epimerase/dehydratase family protein [Chloroflexota bacterium]
MMQTIFVAGGTGFIGSEFVLEALKAGHQVVALARSDASAETLRKAGARPVSGDLLTPGDWQAQAAQADAVVHIAQPLTFGGRVTKQRAEAYRRERLQMDANLLSHLARDGRQRIIYVSGTSYYGNLGPELLDETATPQPMGWGPYVVEALAQVRQFQRDGLAIIEAFPGQIYGAGSWYKDFVTFFRKGNPFYSLGGRDRYNSFMHVTDVARGLVHLLEHGQTGERYFLVDDEPSSLAELARLTADQLSIRLRRQRVPYFLLELLFGPVVAESLKYENRLSNAKLRATGFVPRYPTLRDGVPTVIKALNEM